MRITLRLVGRSLSKEEASCATCDFPVGLSHFCVSASPVQGCADTFPAWLTLSPARALHASMARPELALTFLLTLAPLLLAWGQMHHGPVTPWEAGKSGLCLSLTKMVLLLLYLHICSMALPCWYLHIPETLTCLSGCGGTKLYLGWRAASPSALGNYYKCGTCSVPLGRG